jgi:hypothetical protein
MITPSVGRIVHYRSSSITKPMAAIITAVGEGGRANLTVFMDGGAPFAVPHVLQGEREDGDYWEAPPYVPQPERTE